MRYKIANISLFLILLLLCLPLATQAALPAADEPSADLQDTLQEVTVVNQRLATIQQSASSQHTDIYMRRIEQEQRFTYKDMSGLVPNFYVPDYGSRMTSSIYIRGLGARIDNPVLGLYVDGIGLANKNSYDFDLFDIRSMSLYRGPQGTLFGRNTIGGVLLVETLSPLTYQGTRASVGYGNYNTVDAKASHYHLISNRQGDDGIEHRWGIGAAAYYKHTDGYFTNQYNGSRVDASNEAGARIRIDGENSRGYRNSTFINYNFVSQGGFPYHLPEEAINHNDTCAYLRHNLTFGSSYTVPVGDYLISGTTAYQYLQDRMQMDQDYLPLSYFTLEQAQKEHFVSQEVSLKPKTEFHSKSGKTVWNWLTGISLSYKHNRMSAPVTFKRDGIDSLILKNANASFADWEIMIREPEFVINSEFTTQNTDAAAFHTSYLTFGDWRLEAGLRLDFEHQSFIYDSYGTIHPHLHNLKTDAHLEEKEITSRKQGRATLNYFEALPRLGASYNRPEWQVYLSVAEGYKAGGFNTQLFSDILQNQMRADIIGTKPAGYDVDKVITYKPERCLSFEAGANGRKQWENISLQGSLTAFCLEVFNQQQTVFPEVGTGRLMTNAGRSRSAGAEVSSSFSFKDLTINAAYGYTYAVFVDYDNGKADYSGNRVPYVPNNTLSAGITYHLAFSHSFFHSLDLNVNTSAYGKIYWDEENKYVQPFYALLNANISLQMKYLTLTLWGKNLTDTHYDVFRFVSMGNTFLQSGKPLTFGARLNFEI
ncbi:MAG: TonB-dependent receptor [Paludibacteraceae bacterium]|nr:TonB-dependent receptor [Paludibacteraceae bacterium]